MSADDLEQDDLSGVEDDEPLADEVEEVEESDGTEVAAAVPSSSKKPSKAAAVAASAEELPSLQAKQKEREALDKAIAEFLARGGKVQEIGSNVLADPPKKPESKYGSRPI